MQKNIGRIPVRLSNGQNAAAELVGQRFGKLVVKSQEPGRLEKGGYTMWRAQCDCGREIVRPSYRFLNKRYGMKQCPGCAPLGRPRIADNGAHVTQIFGNRRGTAVRIGRDWRLTKEAFRKLCEGNCHYCGAPPVLRVSSPNLSGRWAFNGIDRMDNEQGYIPGNVVSCCWTCNRAKGQSSYVQFVAWLDHVAEYRSARPKRSRQAPDHPELALL